MKTTSSHTNTISFFFLLLLHLYAAAVSSPSSSLLLPPPDAVALLSFKSQADLDNVLLYSLNERFDYCDWQGVTCLDSRVVRLSLPSHSLRGSLPHNSSSSSSSSDFFSGLSELRFLNLRNNSLSGPIPDDISSLSNLRLLDLSFNKFEGRIPVEINRMERIESLKLEFNRFEGEIPPIVVPDLRFLNVSGNNLTGEVPNTPTLSRFNASSFEDNPFLCGDVVNVACKSSPRFFTSRPPPPPSSYPSPAKSDDSSGEESSETVSSPPKKHLRRAAVVVVSFCFGGLVLASSLICFVTRIKRRARDRRSESKSAVEDEAAAAEDSELFEIGSATATEKRKTKEDEGDNNNNLVFCVGEEEAFTVEELMRSTAEILGRGTVGATYKARLDNGMILTVKRMDRGKMMKMDGEMFERHMERVGALRHPNLVSVRAFFKGKGAEMIVVYDYLRNGSVFNLVHGSRSTRAKPLHWTSCLKIAEDVAQGLAYIHQASKFIHGNLKATNVLLGADFEACITDYCLTPLIASSNHEDSVSTRYQAPETRKSSSNTTTKSDVYAFGVLLLELLSGKPPSQHPFLAPPDLPDWVRAMRGESSGEEDRLGMLIEVASVCSVTSPEQRPSMSQVLKMIQNIKTSIVNDSLTAPSGRYS